MINRPPHPPPVVPPLIIIGASTRAAAWSAHRAGFTPLCCDQFADADLQAAATVVKVGSDPREFVEAVAGLPEAPLMYTGGLENHPEVIEEIATSRKIWGMNADVLRAVRDPVRLADALRSTKQPYLEVRTSEDRPPADGQWMVKPIRSAGGHGIEQWTAEAAESPTLAEPHYFQQRLEGTAYSGVFVASVEVGDVRFVGLTEQIIGEPELHGYRSAWCGNIGPTTLNVEIESAVRRIANVLKWKFQLCGLFGIDFIVSPDGKIGVTEVNPRYPSSLEILEFATGTALLRDHCQCFEPENLPTVPWQPNPGSLFGKAILYSPDSSQFDLDLPVQPDAFRTWPRWADVPEPGSHVQAGGPLLTVYAQGESAAECRERLINSATSILTLR